MNVPHCYAYVYIAYLKFISRNGNQSNFIKGFKFIYFMMSVSCIETLCCF